MILILTYANYEQGTDGVLDWLLHKQVPFIRLSAADINQQQYPYLAEIENPCLWLEHKKIYLEDISVVWFRRWQTSYSIYDKSMHQKQLSAECTAELKHLSGYFFDLLKDKVWLSHPDTADINKLTATRIAQQFGISTPKSIVCNNKAQVMAFFNENPDAYLIKPITQSGYFIEDNATYKGFTKKINAEDIKNFPAYFFPTLFQTCVSAKYEIRTFYLDGAFYSTAILPKQNHEQESDIKTAYLNHTVVQVPYQLPKTLETQLHLFFQYMRINTGSIDLLRSQDGSYVFLEINPVGQYSAHGYCCNYYLEEKIANWLAEKYESERKNCQIVARRKNIATATAHI